MKSKEKYQRRDEMVRGQELITANMIACRRYFLGKARSYDSRADRMAAGHQRETLRELAEENIAQARKITEALRTLDTVSHYAIQGYCNH
jgi:hypothetical protein